MSVSLKVLVYLLFFVFLSSRILLIEKDLPPLDISGYAQIDEAYYAILALDKIDFGTFFYNKDGLIEPHATFLGTSFILNVLCYFNLLIFGDTYWGLRMTSILLSLGVIFLLILTFKHINKEDKFNQNKYKNYFPILFICILCADFSFLFSNIVVEPTLLRLFISVLFILLSFIIITQFPTKFSIFFLGLIAVFSWLLVYLMNIYIPLSIGTVIILNNIFKGYNFFKDVFIYVIGIITGLIIILLLILVLKVDLLDEVKYIILNFSERTALSTTVEDFYLKKIAINGVNFFKANFFNYNPLLLLAFVFFTLKYLYLLIKDKSERKITLAFISLIFLIVYFFQSLFVNDFFTRKLLITFPFYLIISYHTLLHSITKPNKLWHDIIFFIISLFIVSISQSTQKWIFHCTGTDFFLKTFNSLSLALVISLIVLLFYFLAKNKLKTFYLFLILLIFNNIYFTYEFAFKNVSDMYKRSMQKLASFSENSTLVGSFSIGFRLYNSSATIINPYMYYNKENEYLADIKKLTKSSKNTYIITYDNDLLLKKLNTKKSIFLVDDYCTGKFFLYKVD